MTASPRNGSRLRRLLQDRSAVAGIEFALVLPFLLLLYAGSVELGHALTVSRKLDQIASTVADMISQQSAWTTSEVKNILTGSRSILQPYDLDSLKIVVAVDNIDTHGFAKVGWSAAYNTLAPAKATISPVEVPATVQDEGVQMIVTRVNYTLVTPFSAFFSAITGIKGITYQRDFLTRPRVSDMITYN